MSFLKRDIQIVLAPSILGLKPGGVERLGESLLSAQLADNLHSANPVISVPANNLYYSFERDKKTGCLNPSQIRDFSITLIEQISQQLDNGKFPLVLGGDCSILLGIMPALKSKGEYGIIFLDAHADFYEPFQSPTGEVADMDLAIITGRGPGILTNINNLVPYVKDKNVIHVGQRDGEETKKYNSRDIQDTLIRRYDLETIRTSGLSTVINEILLYVESLNIKGFWIHFDTDVLSDDENPAVDYRIPGGLIFEEVEFLLRKLLSTGKSLGMSVTIFNPDLDTNGKISNEFQIVYPGHSIKKRYKQINHILTKVDPIIAVKDVEASSKWYQSVFGCRSMHGGKEFEILVAEGDEILICLHKWGEHQHSTMTDPSIPPGNGLILYFRTDNMNRIRQNADKISAIIAEEVHLNQNSMRKEFSLRDPDGYYLTVTEFHRYEG